MDSGMQQQRVYLWTASRCTSTAFLRCIQNKPKTKVIREPFQKAYYLSPDKTSDRFSSDSEGYTEENSYENIQGYLNGDFKGYETIFVKDMALYLFGGTKRYHSFIPKGYTHSILIRNPILCAASLYNLMNSEKVPPVWRPFRSSELGLIELFQLYNILKEEGHDVIIIDSNDFLGDPEAMLRMYCMKVGMEYCNSMVNWRELTDADKQYFAEGRFWREDLLKSLKLGAPKRINTDLSFMPDELQSCIRDSMVSYQKLYELRSVPSSLKSKG